MTRRFYKVMLGRGSADADEWLEDSISMWDYILGTFDKTVRDCEEPKAKDDPF